MRKLIRQIRSSAPTRICDIGGWTDTWFAEHGKVFNIAVSPRVQVELDLYDDDGHSPPFTISARNYNDRYSIGQPNGNYRRHPLIEASLDCIRPPEGLAVEMSIYSEAPAGASTGTSAAVTVAVIGALKQMTHGALEPHDVAATAHRIETEFLHRQCGIQDQIAAAFGGINFVDMDRYPHAAVERITLPEAIAQELEARLALIYVGKSHSSSHVHDMVIRALEDAGPGAPQLERLRATAAKSRDALSAGDFAAFGEAMIDNTEAQRALHPNLVGSSHQKIIDIAREQGAWGWKVNGAGGQGGSVTLLGGPGRDRQPTMLRTIESANPRFRSIPIQLSPLGLRVWEPAGE